MWLPKSEAPEAARGSTLRSLWSSDASRRSGRTGGQVFGTLILDVPIPFRMLKAFSGVEFKIRGEFFLSNSFYW